MGTVTRRRPGAEAPETPVAAWKAFEAHLQTVQRHSLDGKFYGVSFASGPDGGFDYLTGMAVRPGVAPPDGLEVRLVPGGTYAVFDCPVQAIGATYRYIFAEWRAESGCATDAKGVAFEEYPPATEPTARVLLHIPIRESPVR